LDPLIWRRDS